MSLTKFGVPLTQPAVPLDALRSPQLPAFEPTPAPSPLPSESESSPERDSIASTSSFNDVALDDDVDASTAALTDKTSLLTLDEKPTPPDDAEPIEMPPSRPFSASSSFSVALNDFPTSSHKKNASTTTIRSSHRISADSVVSPTSPRRLSARASLEGTQKLQEEFARLQKEEQAQQPVTGEGYIDWGMLSICPSVLKSERLLIHRLLGSRDIWHVILRSSRPDKR